MAINTDRSPDTQAVVDVLRGVNGEILYKDLARRASLSLARTKSVLTNARRILQGDNILFGTMTGIGLKRLTDEDKVRLPRNDFKKLKRAARRARKKSETIDNFDQLSLVNQTQVTTDRYLFSLIEGQAESQLKPAAPSTKPVVEAPEMPTAENLIRLKK